LVPFHTYYVTCCLIDKPKCFPIDVTHVDEFLSLYHELKECDAILANMEDMLSGFQTSLGHLSEEIESLQTQSIAFNMRLKNRKDLKARTGNFVNRIEISRDLSRNLLEAELNDHYLHFLTELQGKIQFIKDISHATTSSIDASSSIVSLNEALPELEKLQRKVVQRFRRFFITKLRSIKSPTISLPLFQQEQLLRYKLFFLFLEEYDMAVAHEIRDYYIDHARQHYIRLFELCDTHLKSREVRTAGDGDLCL
jgi:vacuolar protein sorting-associated protein 52